MLASAGIAGLVAGIAGAEHVCEFDRWAASCADAADPS